MFETFNRLSCFKIKTAEMASWVSPNIWFGNKWKIAKSIMWHQYAVLTVTVIYFILTLFVLMQGVVIPPPAGAYRAGNLGVSGFHYGAHAQKNPLPSKARWVGPRVLRVRGRPDHAAMLRIFMDAADRCYQTGRLTALSGKSIVPTTYISLPLFCNHANWVF